MKQEINLLTVKREKEKKLSPFLLICLSALLLSVVFVVASLLYVLFLKTTLSGLSANEKSVLSEINKLSRQRLDLLTTSERLLSIKKIVPLNSEFSERIGLIVKNMPEDIIVENLTIKADKISMKISTSNLSFFNIFFNTSLLKISQQKKPGIKKIDILSFSVIPNGGYTALIDITFNSDLSK